MKREYILVKCYDMCKIFNFVYSKHISSKCKRCLILNNFLNLVTPQEKTREKTRTIFIMRYNGRNNF